MDPDPEQIARVPQVGADRIELYTGPFAEMAMQRGLDAPETVDCLEKYRDAARQAVTLGLGVNAGHDLDQHNLRLFRRITEVAEVSIGHALISDALNEGLAATVRAYLAALAGTAA
jgi:pyridoxine 5-phosphate synthase